MANRPDILLSVIDTQRLDRLTSFGYAREEAPLFCVRVTFGIDNALADSVR